MLFKTIGTLDFHSVWAVAWVDVGIGAYYRALCPKAWGVQPPKYKPHVTVVSKYDVLDRTSPKWKKYQGQKVRINYDGIVYKFGLYYGLDAWSDDIIAIKQDLGVKLYAPGHDRFHITIGNVKNA